MNTVTKQQCSQMIAAAEVWTPLGDGSGIELAQTLAEPAIAEALPTQGDRLLGGEGLAGQAWAREVPLLISQITPQEFPQAEALKERGVAAAVALPTFDRGKVSAVLLLYLRGGEGVQAGVEFWAGRSGQHELSISDAHHGDLDRFAKISRYVNFPIGSGLPGKVWETGRPRVMPNLSQSPDFLRSTGAESDGLTVGFGLPLIRGLELRGVLLTLDSPSTYAARVYEVWELAASDQAAAMRCTQSAHLDAPEFTKAGGRLNRQPGVGLVGKAWASRRPEIAMKLSDTEPGRDEAADQDGLTHGIAIPVLIADEVRAVALMAW